MSTASDITGLLFFLLFLLFLNEYRSLGARRIIYAAIFCGIYSILIKLFYGIFFILGLGAAFYVYQKDGLIDRRVYKQILLNTVCLCLPFLCVVPIFLLSDSKAGVYSCSFIIKNFFISLSYLFNFKQNTILTSLAFGIAIIRSVFYEKDNLVIWIMAWFLLSLVMISAFCAGGIIYPGNVYSDRYILTIAFPYVYLAAIGIVNITIKKPYFWGVIVFVILILNAFFASRYLTNEARNGFFNRKTLLLNQVFLYVPNEAYLLDESSSMLTTITSKKVIHSEIFLGGDHPKQVVFLKGLAGDIYNPADAAKIESIQNVLNAEYVCKSLTAGELIVAGLRAKPLLCQYK